MKGNTQIGILAIALGFMLGLTACGNPGRHQSNPLKDHPEFDNDVPLKDYKTTERNYQGANLFSLQIDDTLNDSRTLEFFEGQERKYVVHAGVMLPGTNFALKDSQFPEGASLTYSGKGDAWTLRWRPKPGLIPKNLNKITYQGQIQFVLGEGSSSAARELFAQDNINRIKAVTFNVNFPEAQPKVQVIGLDKKEYRRGEVVDFKLVVEDPNSSQIRRPDWVVTYDRKNESGELKSFPLSTAVIPDPDKNDQFTAPGKWTFHFMLDTTTISEKFFNPKAGYQVGSFVIYAINPSSKLDSMRILKRIKIVAKE